MAPAPSLRLGVPSSTRSGLVANGTAAGSASSTSQSAFELETSPSTPNRQHGSEDAAAFRGPSETAPAKQNGPVTWMMVPRKDQLFILFLCRVVDFLQVASLQAYVFFQLKSFDRSLSDAQVSAQAGILQGCFSGAQVLTAVLWGKMADAPWGGRKRVIMVGLGGTAVSCVGYSFATSFFWVAFWRAFGGAINGTVGSVRTMVSEVTKEKKFQSRAFLILPMSFNVANTLGPIMGGFLADATVNMPGLFAEGGLLAFQWVEDYPFALPSLLNAVFLSFVTLAVFLALEETSPSRKDRPDLGLRLWIRLKALLLRTPSGMGYSALDTYDTPDTPLGHFEGKSEQDSPTTGGSGRGSGGASISLKRQQLPFRRIWTRNVILVLITLAFFDFHLGAFQNIWSLFLSTPRSKTGGGDQTSLSGIQGGLGMSASIVGVATSFTGILGMFLQLGLYPTVHGRLGTLRSLQYFLFLFPVSYFLTPYVSALPSSSQPPDAASGPLVWVGIVFVLLLQVMARTFTMPASIMLLNNCSPHPSVLGTIHGLGQSVSAGFRTVGPVVGGWWYGSGLDAGHAEFGWWGVAGMAALGCISAIWVYEGSGHEILLEGE